MTEAFEVQSYVGALGLKFGDAREQVRSMLGEPQTVQPKSDRYDGLVAHYGAGALLVELAFVAPAEPTFGGRRLLGLTAWQARHLMEGEQAPKDPSLIVSRVHGISFWAPLAKGDLNAACEAVTIFQRGRYDPVF